LIKALARDPAQRYQTMREFLNGMGSQEGDESRTVDLLEAMPTREDHGLRSRKLLQGKKGRLVWVLPGLGVIILFSILGIGIYKVGGWLYKAQAADENVPSTQSAIKNPIGTEFAIATESLVMPVVTELPGTTEATSGQTSINPRDKAEMIYIPAATFKMGLSESEKGQLQTIWKTKTVLLDQSIPQHSVTLDAYWIYKTEVSNEMYSQCVMARKCIAPVNNGSKLRTDYYNNSQYRDYPVVYVTWKMAHDYCLWAKGELPTEAQWEYAARGPQEYIFPWGNLSWDSSLSNVWESGIGDTTPIYSYQAGASWFGLLNMSGNVYEWVFDWYQEKYYQTNSLWINPTGPNNGDIKEKQRLKSVRGGSYSYSVSVSNGAIHDWEYWKKSSYNVGFRCAKNP
jgi:formylglycine-generating enzyme required for sulfatase activity